MPHFQCLKLSKALRSHGWTIKYGVFGEETPNVQTVVFVHGTPWSSVVFKPLAKALLARGGWRVVLYDLAGYGESQEYLANEVEREGKMWAGGKSPNTAAHTNGARSDMIFPRHIRPYPSLHPRHLTPAYPN